MFTVFFCLQLETNLSVSHLKAQKAFFVIQVFVCLFFFYFVCFFFLLGEIKDIFQFCLTFTEGEKRKHNYR